MAGYLVPKWVRGLTNGAVSVTRARHLCFAKDWLGYQLTGELTTDRTEASSSQLWDPGRRTWSPELAEAFEVPLSVLPDVKPSLGLSGLR